MDDTKEINAAIERELTETGCMHPDLVVAMTIWGEAGSELVDVKRAVACVIYNRALSHSITTGYPISVAASEVCLAQHQFDCWLNGKFVHQSPDESSDVWAECVAAAKEIFLDSYAPFLVANSYYIQRNSLRALRTKDMECVGHVGGYAFYLEKG